MSPPASFIRGGKADIESINLFGDINRRYGGAHVIMADLPWEYKRALLPRWSRDVEGECQGKYRQTDRTSDGQTK